MTLEDFFDTYKPEKSGDNRYIMFFTEDIIELLARRYNFNKISKNIYTYGEKAIITYSKGYMVIELFNKSCKFERRLNEKLSKEGDD
jgi:hypothetical protein